MQGGQTPQGVERLGRVHDKSAGLAAHGLSLPRRGAHGLSLQPCSIDRCPSRLVHRRAAPGRARQTLPRPTDKRLPIQYVATSSYLGREFCSTGLKKEGDGHENHLGSIGCPAAPTKNAARNVNGEGFAQALAQELQSGSSVQAGAAATPTGPVVRLDQALQAAMMTQPTEQTIMDKMSSLLSKWENYSQIIGAANGDLREGYNLLRTFVRTSGKSTGPGPEPGPGPQPRKHGRRTGHPGHHGGIQVQPWRLPELTPRFPGHFPACGASPEAPFFMAGSIRGWPPERSAS